MKPRNKYERTVFAQSKKLRPITKAQTQWAFKECIEHYAFRLPKGRTVCMDCGYDWIIEKSTETCTCPHCRARLQVQETLKRKLLQKCYFTVLTTCGEYQVLRMYLLIVGMEKGCSARSSIIEIGQYWWNNKGKKTVIALQRTLGRYIDTFSFYSSLAIRNDNFAYQHIANSKMYPKFKILDTLHRNGFNGDFHFIAPIEFIPALLADSRVETMVKAGRYIDLKHFLNKQKGLDNYWDEYKLVIRHHYDISDIALWCDYIDMLRRLGKDTHNPKYVCPSNLTAEHDKREMELHRKREKEALKQTRQKAMEDEMRFKELKSKFFGICFTDGTIQVRTLESVEEYLIEGMELHHCVFSNEYYLKENSLILSATIKGKRIETVEVSLDTLQVVQSRGVCNSTTEYHDQIINLVQHNIRQIAQRLTA